MGLGPSAGSALRKPLAQAAAPAAPNQRGHHTAAWDKRPRSGLMERYGWAGLAALDGVQPWAELELPRCSWRRAAVRTEVRVAVRGEQAAPPQEPEQAGKEQGRTDPTIKNTNRRFKDRA